MAKLRGQLQLNAPMAKHNSWHVGGTVKQSYRPADIDDLAVFLSQLPEDETIVWLGLGSNVLWPDDHLEVTVILTQGRLAELQALSPGKWRVEAGVTCAKFARVAARAGAEQAAFFAGIPGTIGGALAMNAGAYGGETWESVQAVETIDRQGQLRRRSPEDFQVAYREVSTPADEWFVAAELGFELGEIEAAQQAIKQLLKSRNASQPIGRLSCGSVFRNPPGDYAARLIESCGLKGYQLGQAQVSDKHANFIVNAGGATAAEIVGLMDHVQATVLAKTGVELQCEVHRISEEALV